MAEARTERRLAAILAADVVGYSRLMQADELGTLARLKVLRHELIDPQIAAHGGRIVKLMGDGMLGEFTSAVDAAECAVTIQAAVARANTEMDVSHRLAFRFGINLGDVIIEGDDIYGDGVNIAARLQEIAEPGGVCISEKVFAEVHGKLDVEFRDGGKQAVKNITDPVQVWNWCPDADIPSQNRSSSSAAAPTAAAIRPAGSRPSIAVLPFSNMSRDPDQEYFSDGITEDIITELSKFPWFGVAARNSTFAYKGETVDIKKTAEALGVRYVLKGSVRKSGNRVRINAQFIDAASGDHVWAERYDRELEDVFEVQDEITHSIIAAVAPGFLSAEGRRSQRARPEDLTAWDLLMRARWHLWRLGREDNATARELLTRVVELDPQSGMGLADLAWVNVIDAIYGWGGERADLMAEASRLAQRAVELDTRDAWAQSVLGLARLFERRHEEALRLLDRAISLNPNFAAAHGFRGAVLMFAGQAEAAIAACARAVELSPRDPLLAFILLQQATAHYVAGRYQEAADWARKTVQERGELPAGHRQLAAACGQLGQGGAATAALDSLTALLPRATLDGTRRALPFARDQDLEHYLDGLRKAGMPE